MRFLSLLFCAAISVNSFSQITEKVQVFVSGTEGHKSYRIPAIIRTPGGDLLAFCEGRVHDAADFGDINMVMKRSADQGVTWGAIQTVVDYESLQAGNPAPVVDLTDPAFPQGRIFLFYNTGNNHESEVRKGNGLREVWYKTSTDGGFTWSEPVNITTQTHRPSQPQANPLYSFSEDWRSYANTPGHAVQFESGKYKGRIFVAANHSAGNPQPQFTDYHAHGFYTDDHGKTFHLSENITLSGSNEAMATVLSNDRLMMNMRNQRGDVRERIVAISSNGGASWDTTYFDKNLPDPVCQGSILAIGKRKNILAFCNPADTLHRNNLTLRISFDDGKSWRKNLEIDKSQVGQEMSHSSYSDLVEIGKNAIGILYERNNYKEIVFVKRKWK
jgi:sialidase-1